MGLALICTANGPQCLVAEDTYSPYATDNKGFFEYGIGGTHPARPTCVTLGD